MVTSGLESESLFSFHPKVCESSTKRLFSILLPNVPIQEGVEIPIFVVDWEMAQLGVSSMDHGQMLAELLALWLYKKIDAGLWMVQGYAEELGIRNEASAWRVAVQVGIHLVSFGTVAPDWETPDQDEDVVRLGRDIIVNSWERNREWFSRSELACLFTQAVRESSSASKTAPALS